MEQNLNVFDFQLSAEDMSLIAALDTKQTLFYSHPSVSVAPPRMRDWISRGLSALSMQTPLVSD